MMKQLVTRLRLHVEIEVRDRDNQGGVEPTLFALMRRKDVDGMGRRVSGIKISDPWDVLALVRDCDALLILLNISWQVTFFGGSLAAF